MENLGSINLCRRRTVTLYTKVDVGMMYRMYSRKYSVKIDRERIKHGIVGKKEK